MTAAELREAAREYDRVWTGPGLPGKSLTAADRALHRQPAVAEGLRLVMAAGAA